MEVLRQNSNQSICSRPSISLCLVSRSNILIAKNMEVKEDLKYFGVSICKINRLDSPKFEFYILGEI